MSKRGRNLAALAALGALGYEYMARGDKQDGTKVPVRDAVPVGTRAKNEDERDGTASVDPLEAANAREPIEVPAGPRVSSAATSSPARSMAPAKQKLLKTDEDFPPVRMPAKSTASTSPGTMGAYVSRAGTRTGPASSAQSQLDAANRAARTPEAIAQRKAQIEGQALGRVSPEEFIGPGAGLKGAAALAKKLASYTPQSKAATQAAQLNRPGTVSGQGFVVRDYNNPASVAREASKETLALPAPRVDYRSLTGTAREDGKAAQAYDKLKNSDFILKPMKRGGAVKKMASGGSTSGASRRGDGIAQRGKTKGRMY